MSATAVAGLLRRYPRCNWPSRGGRSLATQSTTESSALAQSIPWLLFTSPANLESRYLYTLANSKPASIRLKLDRKFNLPEIARNWIIGSSHGYLISMPALSGHPRDFHAINPITGALLHIPSTSDLMIRVKGCKLLLSPSLDQAAFLPGFNSDLIGLSDLRSSSWRSLSLPTMYGAFHTVHDCIFHKGYLYVTDRYATVTVFDDLENPSIYKPGENRWCDRSMLVESPEGDDLYLLVRECCGYDSRDRMKFRFKIFKLDDDDDQWKDVESIGDLAMFVARNGAMSLHACHSPLLKPDCIYLFGDDSDDESDQSNRGIYYMKSRRFKRFGTDDDDHILTVTHPPPILFQPA